MSTLLSLNEPDAPPPSGLALWELGFRPFYLLAALLAAMSVPLWAAQVAGWLTHVWLQGPAWHAHEMLFGFALAVIVGFLFTAGRNWSGQPTPHGRALQVLVALWLLARLAALGPWPLLVLLSNLAFIGGAAWGLARALVAGGNRRNYFFVVLLLAFGAVEVAFHAGLAGGALLQAGLDVVLFVMTVMAGRVVPMFTNNGVPGAQAGRHPVVERAALATPLALLALDVLSSFGVTGAWLDAALSGVAVLAAIAHAARLWLWQPWTTWRTPLVWVLHLAYAWVPLHLLLRAGAAGGLWGSGPAVHALTTGAMGLLTLAMMTRTARGHTARPLRTNAVDVASYALVALAALLRCALPLLWPAALVPAVVASAAAWSLGWLLYVGQYGPWLLRPRLDGRPG